MKVAEMTIVKKINFIIKMVQDDLYSDKLGSYLLRGWTMLADSCDCAMPLMRSRDQSQTICVRCTEDKSKSKTKVAQNDSINNADIENQKPHDTNTSMYMKQSVVLDAPKNAFQMSETELMASLAVDPPRKKTKDVSSVLGDYLLQGWVMLNEHCLVCNAPLMQDRKSGKEGECVVCPKESSATLKMDDVVVIESVEQVNKNQQEEKVVALQRASEENALKQASKLVEQKILCIAERLMADEDCIEACEQIDRCLDTLSNLRSFQENY